MYPFPTPATALLAGSQSLPTWCAQVVPTDLPLQAHTMPEGTACMQLWFLTSSLLVVHNILSRCGAGHGSDNENCAEFCVTEHTFLVNGAEHTVTFREAGTEWGCADRVHSVCINSRLSVQRGRHKQPGVLYRVAHSSRLANVLCM